VFALLVLPVVLLVGLMTFVRLGEANSHDIMLVIGMNRLRHAYLALAPELEPYFITAHHDDHAAILQTYGAGYRYSVGRVLGGTPALVAIINVVLAGVVAALAAAGPWRDRGPGDRPGAGRRAGGGCRPGGTGRPGDGPGSGRLPPALSDPVDHRDRAWEARAGAIGPPYRGLNGRVRDLSARP
jgi:hypothetical protein